MIGTNAISAPKRWRKRSLWLVAVILLGMYLSTAIHHSVKPLPDGLEWTSPYRPAADQQRPLSGELVQSLVERRVQQPDLRALLITDPFNTLYGGAFRSGPGCPSRRGR